MNDPLDPSGPPHRTVIGRHGVKIAYVTLGQGERTLLLANGLGGRLYAWDPLVQALRDRYRIITWDYRGLFDSEAPARRRHLSVPDHAEDAMAILDAEGVDRAVFCGWSMGVQVSLEAATLYPDRLAGLVLLNGTYGHVFTSAFQPYFRVPFASAWGHAVVDTLLSRPGITSLLGTMAPIGSHGIAALLWAISGASPATLKPLLGRYTREIFSERTLPNYLRLFQELDAHSVYHHLRDIHTPALVISGAWDWLTPAYQSHVMARRLPDAEAVHLHRASHFVLLERPEVVIPAIERFLTARALW